MVGLGKKKKSEQKGKEKKENGLTGSNPHKTMTSTGTM